KKMISTFLMGVSVFSLAACGNGGEDKQNDSKSDTLVVYSPNSEGLINATIPAFEEKYDIKVDLIQAGTGELFKKMESEKDSPVADVIFGGSYTQYAQNGDLFEKYVSSEDENVVEE